MSVLGFLDGSSPLTSLRRAGSFDVSTVSGAGQVLLRTTVYLDGDVMTKIADQPIAESIQAAHFAKVLQRGRVVVGQLRRLDNVVLAVWVGVALVITVILRGSPVRAAEVGCGLLLSATVYHFILRHSNGGWLPSLVLVLAPAVLSLGAWHFGWRAFPWAELLIVVANLALLSSVAVLRRYVRRSISRLLPSNR